MALNPWRNNPNPKLINELQILTEKKEQLESKADDIQFQVRNEELQPSKKRKSEVTLWLKRVEQIKQNFESMKEEVLLAEHRDPCKSKALLNEMKVMMEQVDQLLKQGEFSQGLVLHDLMPKGINIPTTKMEGSTPSTVKEDVWSAFMRGESRVGIFGMGGVGKTTVAIHVNNEILSGWDCFNHVFYVTVGRGSTVHKLQHDISIALALILKNEDETRRAAELSDSLKKREKSLLILDDIWEDIPMEKVGVSVEGDGCKLFITTRKKDVCCKMSCDTMVEMKPLLENEAWDLFVNKLGNYELLNDATKCVARSIAEECAGLPLAIITMASCMRGECDVREWRHMLRQLQNPCSNQHDMDNKVFNILKHSYERLSNDKLRECLLYCALYLEDYQMSRDTSIIDFIAVALLRNEGTRKENTDEGRHMLKTLADASLLECWTDDYGCNIVKMHDLIRDMTVKIIGNKGIVKPGKGMEEMPRKEEWTKDLVLVSLMGNWIKFFGDEICPECPNLSVLILRGNPLCYIPHSLFLHMECLRCLDLSATLIYNLPNSISNLCNLDALLLFDCSWLRTIPSLTGLTKLKDLNLSRTAIKELPEGVEELINLKYLDITETMVHSIPEGLLCKLCKLESFLSNYTISIAPKVIMTSLRQLLSFKGWINDFDGFKHFVGSDWLDQLETYSINVGDRTSYYHLEVFTQCERHIIIRGRQLSVRREVGFKVPHSVQFLELEDCSFGVECLLEALPSLCGATEMEEISLDECKGIKYIISGAQFERGKYELAIPVKGVHRLTLVRLYDFVGLYEGEAVRRHIFFGDLRNLHIDSCPSVIKIWLQGDDLPSLEVVEVFNCKSMEEVFAMTRGAAVELPCLKSMTLQELPELRSICQNHLFLPCLEKVLVKGCPKLEKLWSVSLKDACIQSCDQMKQVFAITDETTTIKELTLLE